MKNVKEDYRMVEVVFIMKNEVRVEKVDGNIETYDSILKLAKDKGAKGCYVITNSVIDLPNGSLEYVSKDSI